MASFEIKGPEGGTYRIDAPDEQSAMAAFSQLHGSKQEAQPAAPDPYRLAAEKKFADYKSAGIPIEAPLGRRMVQGMTFGAGDEIMAALNTPLEMIDRRTLNPAEAYKYAK